MNTLANSAVSSASAVERIEELDWQRISQELDAQGCAILEGVLNREECRPCPNSIRRTGTFEAVS